jgi:hypothetical protein
MRDREARELMIAFTAIVLVWSVAGGLTFVSALLFGHEVSSLDGPTEMIGDWLERQGAPSLGAR